MLVVAVAWAPWLVSASVVLAGVWLTLQVLTVGEAAAIVSRIESREGRRSVGSRFDYVAEADLEAARRLIPQVRGRDAPVPPNEGGRLATAVQAALNVMRRAAMEGTVKPAALPDVEKRTTTPLASAAPTANGWKGTVTGSLCAVLPTITGWLVVNSEKGMVRFPASFHRSVNSS